LVKAGAVGSAVAAGVVAGGAVAVTGITAVAGAGSGAKMITIATAEGGTITGRKAGIIIGALLYLLSQLEGCVE